MKILIVSWYMPPYNTMGALRVGKFAHYLDDAGHDVRALCASGLPYAQTLAQELPEGRIVRTPYRDVNAPLRALNRMLRRLRRGTDQGPVQTGSATGAAESGGGRSSDGGLMRRLRVIWQEVINFPDAQVAWRLTAVPGGAKMLRGWRPDIIFASAPPFTTLMIGRRLSHRFGIPWVAEYRDRFYEDPYDQPSALRKKAEKSFEHRLLRGVSGIVTVSEPWAEDYRTRFGLPVACVYNGFDPVQFPADFPRAPTDPDVLRIVYTGTLYAERRDPSPLFEAMSRLGDAGRAVRVEFYGADEAALHSMASRHGVPDRIRTHQAVSYDESIALQMNADILLLLQWNDPREAGNVPGKLFEYIGARRPVLGIGYEGGVPARILRERGAGVVLNDPELISSQLKRWLKIKRSEGVIPLLPENVRDDQSRPEQYRKAEEFLIERAAKISQKREHP